MPIRPLTAALPASELSGKYLCAPALVYDQAHGYPALIEKATATQLVFRKLHRGSWDSEANEWRVDPDPAHILVEEPSRKCKRASVKFVCDTAEEAIALYAQAIATRKAIEQFRRDQLARVEILAAENRLPVPAYLAHPHNRAL